MNGITSAASTIGGVAIPTMPNVRGPAQPNIDAMTDGAPGGSSFGEILKEMVLHRPSESKFEADKLVYAAATGGSVDPHNLAITTAKAGVEIQMATRVISSAVTGIRTLMQTQI